MEEIARVTNGNWKPGCPVNVKEYSIDSRSVMNPEHTLFFALKGKNHDGHDYIASGSQTWWIKEAFSAIGLAAFFFMIFPLVSCLLALPCFASLKKGDEVDAIVLLVDPENQRISLGMKQLTVDPWEEIDSLFKVGDLVTGKVSKITNYGAFIELQNDIDGLVHISQISEDHVEKIKNHLKVGDEVKARVVKIDRDERRIGLSIKAAQYDAEKLAEEVAAFEKIRKDQDLTSLGDLLDEATK